MKEWAWILILISVFASIGKSLLPKGEKSPLYPPLRFLLSLALIVVFFSPLIRMIQNKEELTSGISSLLTEDTESTDGNTLVLKRFGATLGERIKREFPEAEFSLEIHTDENKVPTLIKVAGEDKVITEQIADFIQFNYGLEAIPK